MIRDMGGSNSDGINTKLRISFYNGSGEYAIKDYDYTYGAAVYAFVRYYNISIAGPWLLSSLTVCLRCIKRTGTQCI